MRPSLSSRRRFYFILGVLLAAAFRSPVWAVPSPLSPFDVQDYGVATSTHSWAEPPADHHRLYLDIYNVTDFFDAETAGSVGFADHTILADTLRPTATILWDERFRIQLGVIAEKSYGSDPGFISVDPWIQLLWRPIEPLSVIFGDLDVPHYFLPAIFYPTNYFEQNFNNQLPPIPQLRSVPSNYFTQFTHETGAQVILRKPDIYDDLFFNYAQQDIPEHNEKFALGFVHRNLLWDTLSLHYQAHWIHYGGEINPHPAGTRNDIAETGGVGLQFHPFGSKSVVVGGSWSYLYSHLRQESTDPALFIPGTNGHGRLVQATFRWGRLNLIYGSWRGHEYYHEGGDPMFVLPVVRMGTIRWDILLSRDFNLFFESTSYIIGNNSLHYDHDVKTAFHIQASWQFSIPIMEWSSPAASPEGVPVPARWDYGI